VSGEHGAFAALCLAGPAELYGESRLAEIRRALDAGAAALAGDARKFNM
jgi:hypothetical protein